MYKIIGIDGRQYGPVSVEQIRQWISAGRADGSTMAQSEGMADWKPLQSFPEFAEALASKGGPAPPRLGAPPPLPGSVPSVPVTALPATAGVAGSRGVNVGGCLGRAWDLLMQDLWPLIGVTALVWLMLVGTHAVHVGILVTGPMLGGLYFYYLKRIRRQPAELPDAFAGFTTCFVQLLLVGVVGILLTALGLALCVVPGIYFGVAWSLSVPLVIDKQLGFWKAMELSRKTIEPRWWSMAWLLLLCLMINVGGALLCGIGILFTLPLTMLALTYAYEDLFRVAPTKTA